MSYGFETGPEQAGFAAWKPAVQEAAERRLTEAKSSEVPTPGIPEDAITVETTTSQGNGGQNVNKVETRVRLYLDLGKLKSFSERQKQLLRDAAGPSRYVADGDRLKIESQQERSQHQNRRVARELLDRLVEEALTPQKERKATKPTYASKQRRLDDKSRQSQKKADRRGGRDGW